ncbi:MAG: YbbR-like domain-containing protein [Saprospiraceae bacterium]|nr:YbbR-like domain-containing protein [Saprospiraceae bacterium]
MARSLKILPDNFKISLGADRAILLTCLGIALIFWLFIKLSKSYADDLTFNLEYQLKEDLAFVEMPPAKLITNVEGRGWDLMYLSIFGRERTLTFPVDASNENEINRTEILNTLGTWLDNPMFKIQSVSIDQINLELEKLSRKKVPVKISGVLQTAPNYTRSGPVIIKPDSIQLIGAPSLLDQYDVWETSNLEITGLKNNLEKEVDLQLPVESTLTILPKKVQLEVQVEALTEKRLFIPIVALNPPKDSFTIFPKQVQLTFTVGVGQYQDIDKDMFEAVVDYNKIRSGEQVGGLPINVTKTPANINLINYTPKTAEVLVVLNSLPKKESR